MVICVIATVLIVGGIVYVTSKKKPHPKEKGLFEAIGIPQMEKSVVSLQDIICFFKRTEILEKLKGKPDLIAVTLKERTTSGSFVLLLCIFSKNTNTIIEPCMKIIASELSPDLLSVFGTKDMLILQ